MIEPTPHAEGSVLPVKAQPGSRKAGILGERAGALRVAVSAAPEKGKANAAVAAALAEALGLRPAQVELIAGASARDKRFLIRGIAPEALADRLAALVASPGD